MRRIDSFTACSSSYVNHVAQDSQSTDPHNSLPALADDSAFHPNGSGVRSKLDGSLPYVAVLKARKEHKHPVQEMQRPIGNAYTVESMPCKSYAVPNDGCCHAVDYMRLPASQYSVLDAKKIERLDDDTFICYVGGISFLGFVVEPVLTVSVIVHERGPVVKLLDTKVLFTICMYSTTQCLTCWYYCQHLA